MTGSPRLEAARSLDPDVERLLSRASFCHVAVSTALGPHVTPMVFAWSAGRIWATTSRASTKARAWRADDRTAALVQDGEDSVSFTGRARTFDVLEPTTWVATLREAPTLSLATARFAAKNARFFAGYAADARSVPFAWMPPGRVLVELSIERLRRAETFARTDRSNAIPSVERFRSARTGDDPLDALPTEVAGAVGRAGRGALAVSSRTLSVVPARWIVHGAGVYAVVPANTLDEIVEPRVRVALAVDRPVWWRARDMVGAMVQGLGEIAVAERLASGRRSASEIISEAGMEADQAALVRIHPTRLVWWRGWSSGSTMVPAPRTRATMESR
jgi:hypothetical protein